MTEENTQLAASSGGSNQTAIAVRPPAEIVNAFAGRDFGDMASPENLISPLVHIYRGSDTEDARYGRDKFKKGDLINAMTGEKMSNEFVAVIPFIEYLKFDPENKSVILWKTRDKAEAIRLNGGNSGKDGKPDLYGIEFWNFICVFKGEEWPAILSFSKTAIKEAGRTITSSEKLRAHRGPGLYFLETKSKVSTGYDPRTGTTDSTKKGISYLAPAVRSAGDPPANLMNKAIQTLQAFSGRNISITEVAGAEDLNPEQDDSGAGSGDSPAGGVTFDPNNM